MVLISAQPYDYELPASPHVALVIIDMQRDFLEAGGFGETLGNDVSRLQVIVPAVSRLLATFRAQNLPIIHTIEGHKPDLSDCPPAKQMRGRGTLKIGDVGPMGRILILGESGNNIIPELAPLDDEIVITKPGKGAFCRTELESILQAKQITHLIFTGVTTEVCVQTTMREANDRGFSCLIVADATESYFPEFKQATLAMLSAQDAIIGWVTTADEVIKGVTDMSKSSTHEEN
ncbi:MAG: isochorismatase family cysteine hydrolase [Pseudanabaena sp. ELA607]